MIITVPKENYNLIISDEFKRIRRKGETQTYSEVTENKEGPHYEYEEVDE